MLRNTGPLSTPLRFADEGPSEKIRNQHDRVLSEYCFACGSRLRNMGPLSTPLRFADEGPLEKIRNQHDRVLSEYCFACGSRTRFHLRLRGYRNRTRNQSKRYSRPAQTVLGNTQNRTRSVLGQRHVSFPFPWGSQENLLKIDAFPFSNRTRNRTRTAPHMR